MNMTLAEIIQATGASCDAACATDVAARVVPRVCIDSRAVAIGDLFFCIVGQSLDGHQFAAQAVAAGAQAVVASAPLNLDVPVLLVRDTTLALGQLARAWRERSLAKVIAVTGSAGKTTVKEMLAQVLSTSGRTGKNFRNLNNQIGLPLSILEMDGSERFWVLELGISQPGDMDALGQILAPDVALIVNVGPCHLEGLEDLTGVVREKSILLDYVRDNGFACINADYPELLTECTHRNLHQVLFSGKGQDASYACINREYKNDQISYTLAIHGVPRSMHVSSQVHVAENLTAVTAMAMELGLSFETIAAALQTFAPVTQRFALTQVGGWTLIDDSYNANPLSMRSSIEEASRLAQGRLLVLVLGDMRELGQESIVAHRQLGEVIARTNCAYCFFYGTHAADVQSGLGEFTGTFQAVEDAAEIVHALGHLRDTGGVMLFKGSRGCRMENFYATLERNWA